MRSNQCRKGAEVDFTGGTSRSELWRIPSSKNERVRRAWIPTASLLVASAVLFGAGLAAARDLLREEVAQQGTEFTIGGVPA